MYLNKIKICKYINLNFDINHLSVIWNFWCYSIFFLDSIQYLIWFFSEQFYNQKKKAKDSVSFVKAHMFIQAMSLHEGEIFHGLESTS